MMLTVFLLTFLIFALAMLGLAVGWLFNQRALKGSCGGISSLPGMEDHQCSCSEPCEKRRRALGDKHLEKREEVIEFRF
ncbi:MAG: (Na+)-NQR maturation NqrM [Thiolinea sp.]